ncbi:hypothetical protein FHR81_001049 [Actinoalloteichus hoggarensis]|uniref:hypothetical protein n=1 Tax=Actinoalloteichus hoggarensis TaxID=1470176 RepID=UPI0012FD8331|nr:hypothetical protein [Actinoalloteichus hoggarensis]MBB5920019.1 hypothetical protein [Actinoalloteichus hoggarensis]
MPRRPGARLAAAFLITTCAGLLVACGGPELDACAPAAVAASTATTGVATSTADAASRIALVAADEPYYPTTEELEAAAQVIVRGRVETSCALTRDGVDERVAEVVVRAAVGGRPAADEVVSVAYLPPDNGTPMSADLVTGQEYVLLLTAFDDGHHALVNTTQGYRRIDDSGALIREDGEITLSAGSLAELGLTG